MKFVVRNVMNGCRLGHMSEMKKIPDFSMNTPNCMLYTRFGSTPHLTNEMLKYLEDVPTIRLISASNFIDHVDALTACDGGVAKFTNMTDGHIAYSCPNDPMKEIPTGYIDKNSTSIWARGGKVKVNLKEYMALQEELAPQFYEAMADCDLQEDSSNKRLLKSSQRSLDWLDQCWEIHGKSEKLESSLMLGVLTGGYSAHERCKLAKQLAVRPVAGYVIDGFHPGGQMRDFNMKNLGDIVGPSLKELPKEKPIFIKGAMKPDQILDAVNIGIDIFDSSYCYQITEIGAALTFNFNYQDYTKDSNVSASGFEMDLKGKEFLDDFSPILENCQCYTCRKHTKSYISHLLNTSELLANVLLMMHNFHHYFQFFKKIRQSLEEDKFGSLQMLIVSQRPDQ